MQPEILCWKNNVSQSTPRLLLNPFIHNNTCNVDGRFAHVIASSDAEITLSSFLIGKLTSESRLYIEQFEPTVGTIANAEDEAIVLLQQILSKYNLISIRKNLLNTGVNKTKT